MRLCHIGFVLVPSSPLGRIDMGGKIKKVPFRYSDTLFLLYFLILRQVCFLALFDLRPPSFANFAFYKISFLYSCILGNLSPIWNIFSTLSHLFHLINHLRKKPWCVLLSWTAASLRDDVSWHEWNHLCLPGRTQLPLTPSRASRSRWAEMSQTGLTLGWSWAGGSCH